MDENAQQRPTVTVDALVASTLGEQALTILRQNAAIAELQEEVRAAKALLANRRGEPLVVTVPSGEGARDGESLAV